MGFKRYRPVAETEYGTLVEPQEERRGFRGEWGMEEEKNRQAQAEKDRRFNLDQQRIDIQSQEQEASAQEKRQKQLDEEMIMRAIYGNAGDEGPGDFKRKLSEELINPARPETEAEAKFRANPMTLDMIKQKVLQGQRDEAADRRANMRGPGPGGRGPASQIEAALTYIEGFPEDMQIVDPITQEPRTITKQDVMRSVSTKFKGVPFDSDERFGAAMTRFADAEDVKDRATPGEGFDMGRTARRAMGVVKKMNPFREKSEAEKKVERRDEVLGNLDAQKDRPAPTNFSERDRQAYDWATANPGDPRAAKILQRLNRM